MDQKTWQSILEQGIFSELDIHFAGWMSRHSKQDTPELSLTSALLSQATSDGNICLDLAALAGTPLRIDETETVLATFSKLEDWRNRLKLSGVIGKPGEHKPVILDDQSRLYLHRYWHYENNLAEEITSRSALDPQDIDLDCLRDDLSRLFPPFSNGETDWQKVAAFISVMKKFCIISGGPGTGKSTVISRILALLFKQPPYRNLRVALAAPTGKAAARLQEAVKQGKEKLPIDPAIKESIVPEASTIHRLLGAIKGSSRFRHNEKTPLPVDVVIIDEASMVDLALMSKLFAAVSKNARLILLGDKDQLASVEAGAVLGDICHTGHARGLSEPVCRKYHEITGDRITWMKGHKDGPAIQDCVIELKKSYRFEPESGIGSVSRAVNEGNGERALDLLTNGKYDDISWHGLPVSHKLMPSLKEITLKAFRPYLSAEGAPDAFHLFASFRFLCALRKGPYGVVAMNQAVEQILAEAHLIDKNKTWYRGRPVLIIRNDYNLGLFNGDIGIVLPDPASGDELRAYFQTQEGTIRKYLPVRLPEHETAFAMTVHKSQGSEFDEALFILPDQDSPVLTRELIYTGITRAKKRVEVWGREAVFLEAVHRRTQRSSGLRDALWGRA